MADPILGTDVIIKFNKGGSWIDYACATSIAIEFEMETKSVKTVGDGVWRRKRGQTLGYTINLEGLLVLDQIVPHAFDLLDYFLNMTDVNFRMIFTTEMEIRVIEGYALPTNVNLTGPTEGHGTGVIKLEGNGEPDVRNALETCNAEIVDAYTTVLYDPERRVIVITDLSEDSPTIYRYEYSINGSALNVELTDGSLPATLTMPDGFVTGTNTFEITPVCDNGFPGLPYIIESSGGGGPTCVDVALVGTPTLPDALVGVPYSYTISWTGTAPATLSGTIAPSWATITLDNTLKTVTIHGTPDVAADPVSIEFTLNNCSSGSVNFEDSIAVEENPDSIEVDWTFTETFGSGIFRIYVNGSLVVNTSSPNSGTVIVNNGDTVEAQLSGNVSFIKSLIVVDSISGSMYNMSDTDNRAFSWTAETGHDYTVTGDVDMS